MLPIVFQKPFIGLLFNKIYLTLSFLESERETLSPTHEEYMNVQSLHTLVRKDTLIYNSVPQFEKVSSEKLSLEHCLSGVQPVHSASWCLSSMFVQHIFLSKTPLNKSDQSSA